MDVVDLREFYASPLGHASRRLIARRIRSRWSDVSAATIVGLGYATPYLDQFRQEARAVLGFMPAEQGVVHWPAEGNSATALVDEVELPLVDSSVDFVLVAHGLELTDHPSDMLKEIWRVLAPQGRALLVVPNRRGVWARFDSTPFGHGRPFSELQLIQMLREAKFSPLGWSHALFVPPLQRGFLVRSAAAWERVGIWMSRGFSGVLLVEAMKQVYAISSGKRVKRLVPSLKPALGVRPILQPRHRLSDFFAFPKAPPYE
ncbi:MAG TPA: methyltransferase domain-containing protein [Aestuariivirgaceae bacterium]|jgi:SAM-dependent methyltransferase